MLGIRKIRLMGCNCKQCRSSWYNHHYYQNTMRKSYTALFNTRLRQQGKKEAKSLGEYITEGVKGAYYD